ncbi:Conserved region of Rad21 / Rec8 like protein [Teratosphaeria destructans]|uniref:Conserved region of Rad21 / Rec8 like protein n=1 Tax=Teratosphaeria destructans TaxID=418781 RepID=A0A9W7W3W7_9PEZI|nr:Conserved region of Rad21 / Rec8 like protein [Teratosphaeria destructans]
MFYAEDLLTKNGPLARVWLASNLERKLSKQNVLSEKIETKVKDIIGTGQAPIALRLSGQLLLGVVRIYSRKARYLLDDCNEALVKIKLAFRPGNVDLPSHQTHTAARDALILPDTITDLDLFAPLPDPEELLREPDTTRGPGRDPTMLDFGTSQLLPETQTPSRERQSRTLLDDDDLGLDLGLDPGDEGLRSTPVIEDRSIEIGRRAHTPKADPPTMLDMDDDLGLDFGLGNDTTIGRETSMAPPAPADDDMSMLGGDGDFPMAGMDDETAERNAAALSKAAKTADERRQRDSASPLSSARSSVARDLEETFHMSQAHVHEHEDDDTMVQAAQRVKRRRVMKQDHETELHNSQIRKQQEDRSGILKAPSFLPRDPLLMQLMEMQSNGGFVSSIMGDGRMQGWAPELRGILSIELVTKAGEKKRKRDSGVADVETGSERQESPQLEIPQDDEGFEVEAGAGGDFGGDTTLGGDAGPLLGSDGAHPPTDDQPPMEDDYAPSPGAPFDQTEVPLLHPSQTGPVSLGTKNAVHLLREHFAPDHPADATEPPTPSKRTKNEALFTDLCPEATTTRADATKMFFEMLVLGTKDAIKVEQDSTELGLPIRVRGKRGLWGDWAEKGAGGEIASQTDQPQEVGAEA